MEAQQYEAYFRIKSFAGFLEDSPIDSVTITSCRYESDRDADEYLNMSEESLHLQDDLRDFINSDEVNIQRYDIAGVEVTLQEVQKLEQHHSGKSRFRKAVTWNH